MTSFDLITKDDLEKFKIELFAELKRSGYKLNRKEEQKEWLKSFEVRKLLNISPGTLSTLRRNGTLRFSKIGGLYITSMTTSLRCWKEAEDKLV